MSKECGKSSPKKDAETEPVSRFVARRRLALPRSASPFQTTLARPLLLRPAQRPRLPRAPKKEPPLQSLRRTSSSSKRRTSLAIDRSVVARNATRSTRRERTITVIEDSSPTRVTSCGRSLASSNSAKVGSSVGLAWEPLVRGSRNLLARVWLEGVGFWVK